MQQKIFSTTVWAGIGFVFIVVLSLLVAVKTDEASEEGKEEKEEEAVQKNPVMECNWVVIPGKSRALIKVWTWNNTIQNCHETVMYGDEDDTNLFADRQECMEKCGPKTKK